MTSTVPVGGDVRTVAPGEIVLGLQGTVDYEIEWDRSVIDALVVEYSIDDSEIDPRVRITDERSLLVALLGFLATGEGGERHVESSAIVEQFAARFPREITLGGTCVRAALVLRRLGIPSLLHLVSTDENVRRLLPADCEAITSATDDTLDPHLIIQFRPGDGARVGATELIATEANRVIVANDPPAENLVLSRELGDRVATARVFLVSGFNTINDPAVLRARLDEIRAVSSRIPVDGLVVYEDAGFHDRSHQPTVSDAIGPVADVFSLNEDELQARLGRRFDLLDAHEATAAVKELRAQVPDPTLVVHTRYWTIVLTTPARLADLDSVTAAADAGNATAAGRYAFGDAVTAADITRITAGPRQTGSTTFARDAEHLLGEFGRCLPGFQIEVAHPTTIGLGDTFIGGLIGALAQRGEPSVEQETNQ
ncbi:MAG: ADP-dependent glucokinase/phosphofructokinase [Microbacterium gubbeenense]|uniref:ADP-dependent glucokinase/phosphofructokinase n=1 Tax=Microbacterium gubbeenense TaxID=159896 RepID=UPI003F9906FF